MSQAPSPTMTVTTGPAVLDGDIDEIVSAIDEAGVDAIVEPFPQRMGLPVEPLALAIEIPLGVLGTFILGAAGRKVRNAITKVVDRRRLASHDLDRVVMTIYDPERRVRIDVTPKALADERLWVAISQLTGVPDGGPVSLRWDRSSASLRIESATDQAG